MKDSAFFNWSGGKDSALALHALLNSGELQIKYLLTTLNEKFGRISMHGVREELLDRQAAALGIELRKVHLPDKTSMAAYGRILGRECSRLKGEGIEYAAFGDIFLQDLRQYREKMLALAGLKGVFPLWQRDTRLLMEEFLSLGFKTVVTCVNEHFLDESFAGRVIDKQFLAELPEDVDPCGERGEFHTFVFDGPIFKNRIEFSLGEKVYRPYTIKEGASAEGRFCYCDLSVK